MFSGVFAGIVCVHVRNAPAITTSTDKLPSYKLLFLHYYMPLLDYCVRSHAAVFNKNLTLPKIANENFL